MRIIVEPRRQPSRRLWTLTPILALVLTMAIATGLFAALGYDAGDSFMAFFVSPLTSLTGLTELAVKAAPLLMIAAGLAMAFRAGVSNIGAEGQLIMGAVAGGMAWAAIPAFLRVRFAVSEILTSLMLTYVADLFLNLLVYGPWRDPEGMNFPQSRLFNDDETLGILVDGTRLHTGTLVALGLTLVVWVIMTRSLLGFRIRTVGASAAAARYAGFGTDRVVWFTLLTSGGLAGLAGLFEVAGPIGQIIPQITPGYGFTAIIVAFLGRLHPLGIIPAALVVALSYIGGENAQVLVGLPKAVTGVVQGLLLFILLASDFLVRYRLRLARRAGAAA